MKPENMIVTVSGRFVDPLRLRLRDVAIGDIAHALSHVCRFAGHTPNHYSVAQHCVLVSDHVPSEDALAALLHDASEAYLQDIVRPLKKSSLFGEYLDAEDRAMEVIAKKFGFQYPLPVSVLDADRRMGLAELREFFGLTLPGRSFGIEIRPWSHQEARERFLARFNELMRGGYDEGRDAHPDDRDLREVSDL